MSFWERIKAIFQREAADVKEGLMGTLVSLAMAVALVFAIFEKGPHEKVRNAVE